MNIRDKIAPHLIEGETILWSGRPHLNLVSRLGFIIVRVSGFVIAIIAVALITHPEESSIAEVGVLLALSFIVVILPDLLTGKRRGTCYAVTNRRVISLFNNKGTSYIAWFLPAGIKLVDLPLDTIKDIAVEKDMNLFSIFFADLNDFFLPPYDIDYDGITRAVKGTTLIGSQYQKPFGYLRFGQGNRNNVFCFCLITRGEAEEIKYLIKSRLFN